MREIDANARCEWGHIEAGECCHARVQLQEEGKRLTNATCHAKHAALEAALLLVCNCRIGERAAHGNCSFGEHLGE